jgi:hypothetical protein
MLGSHRIERWLLLLIPTSEEVLSVFANIVEERVVTYLLFGKGCLVLQSLVGSMSGLDEIFCHYWDKHCLYWDKQSVRAFGRGV